MIPEPSMPECEPWPLIEKLNNEKKVTGIFISGHPLDDYKMEVANFASCSLSEVDSFQNRSTLNLVGMVSMVRHLVSKNGNGWGILELQDYQGSMEFRLFGDDYLQFKHLMMEGKAVFLNCGWQKSWRDESLELKIREMRLLEGLAEEKTEGITLKVGVENLTMEFINELDAACKAHEGPHRLRVELVDRTKRLKLCMAAKDRRVNATNGFITALEKMGLDYKLS
jgi:DNA polymerase-3 subunit alpha